MIYHRAHRERREKQNRYDMAEIKSTLDLVMEKTRHLTLSDEEKQEQKEKEFNKKLKGPAQKIQDQAINKREPGPKTIYFSVCRRSEHFC